MKVLLVVCVVGCGRIGFDADSDATAPADATDQRDARTADAPSCRTDMRYVGSGELVSTYRLVSIDAAWNDAKLDCAVDGAHLSIVDDATEAASPLIGDWLGITDNAVEGEWRTLDGELATFLPWIAGEPDGGASENCGRLDNAVQAFQDRSCADLRDYSCECE